MSLDNIQTQYQVLSEQLRAALSTMELNEKVVSIHNEMKNLQAICPHNDGSFDFTETDKCPFCGKKFRK